MPRPDATRSTGRAAPAGRWAALRAFFRAYEADEGDAAGFRARQLQALLQLTPVAMAINLMNAAIILAALWSQAPHAFLVAWASTVAVMAAMGWRGWYRASRRPPRAAASPRAVRRAIHHAALLALAWALPPAVLLPQTSGPGQFFLGMVTTGMICAGGFALSSVPWAATVYVAVLSAGSLVGLARWNAPLADGVAAILLAYAGIVVYSVWIYAKTFGARMVAEARADHQNEVIGLLLRDFEDHASDLLWELDARGRFAHVSPRLADTLRLPAERLRQLPAARLLRRLVPPGDEAAAHWLELQRLAAAQQPFRDAVTMLGRGPQPRWWSLSARPLLGADGRLKGWRGVATDVTDKQLANRRLRWLAHNDALTGLVNRVQFRERLGDALALGTPVAVVMVDLDGFKQVNDSHGHAAGDRLLQVFGARLCAVARRSDVVARLAGDEFALIVAEANGEAEIRPLLDRLLAALREPCRVGPGRPLPLRASLGVAFAPADGSDVDTLLNHADIALYAAKRGGGHRACVFHRALAESNRRRTAVAQALRGALARGEFRLVFQPQVACADGRIDAFEALLRWRHAELGEVSPAEFVPIAEGAGLMAEIGGWVLREACRHAAAWPGSPRVAVNLSATQLTGPDLAARVRAAAGELPAARVEVEITESALIEDAELALATLNALRDEGFRIALDDFGTGYSALGYLRQFPFDTLKIDRSFVRDLASDGDTRTLVDTILAMARTLRMTTVAEGVETAGEAEILRSRGCQALQGYLISRPVEAEAVAGFIERWAGLPLATPAVALPA